MTTSNILFDTNILIYNQDSDNPYYQQAHQYHLKVISGEIKGVITPQNLLEFSAVLTNSHQTNKPLSMKIVAKEIKEYQSSGLFTIIYPNSLTLEIYLELLNKYHLMNNRQIFDVFLVATMLSNNIDTILTANIKDFVFKEIKTIKLTTGK